MSDHPRQTFRLPDSRHRNGAVGHRALLLAVAGSRLLVLLSAVLLLDGVGLQFHLCLPVSLQNGVVLVVKSIHFLEYLAQLGNVPAVAAIPFVQHDSQVEPSQTAGRTLLKDIPLRHFLQQSASVDRLSPYNHDFVKIVGGREEEDRIAPYLFL